jgi:hypothetical protein
MRLTLATLLSVAAVPALAVDQRGVQLRETAVELTVLVKDEDATIDRLAAEATRQGGYFKERAAHRLVARVPEARLESYLATVTAAGTVAERRLTTEDVTAQRAQLAAGLASREAMLKRYFNSMSETSNRDDLQTLQAATGELIAEIEHAKGALRVLDHHARFASVDVSFQVRERRPVRVAHASAFRWLGTVDLNSLLADFARMRDQ